MISFAKIILNQLFFINRNSAAADADPNALWLLPLLIELVTEYRRGDREDGDDERDGVSVQVHVSLPQFQNGLRET